MIHTGSSTGALSGGPGSGIRVRLVRARRQRAFTLVEMMVAMMASILVAMAAFLIARNASSFFQHEARITGAQFASMIGLTRLQSDLRRVSMMSSANVDRDPNICGRAATWPVGLNQLTGLQITQSGSTILNSGDHALTLQNNLSPDSIVIGSVQNTTEHFSVQAMAAGPSGGYVIFIQRDGAWWRTSLASQAGGGGGVLGNIFVVGRFLRLVDEEGRQGFGVINGLNESGAFPSVSVAGIPALPTRTSHITCGCVLPCTGSLINPVARVRYEIRNIANVPNYGQLFTTAQHTQLARHKGAPPIARTELIRVELDAANQPILGTLELVAEYAIDLKFGITFQVPGGPPNNLPTVTRVPLGGNIAIASAIPGVNARPERVTSVQIRLSTRTAHRDRDVGLPATADGGLYRFSLGVNRGFARVRTLIADVQMTNQAAVSWP